MICEFCEVIFLRSKGTPHNPLPPLTFAQISQIIFRRNFEKPLDNRQEVWYTKGNPLHEEYNS